MAFRTLLHILSAALLSGCAFAAPATPPAAPSYLARDDVRAFAHELADREGLDVDEVLRALGKARAIPAVIKAILPPATPATRSWYRYRARYLDRLRIDGGVAFWDTHAAALARAEEEFGVPASIIVGIIGVETVYGRVKGNFEVLSALSTLAFDYPPRAELFKRELGQLFVLAHESQRPVESYHGSYAGAIGWPQFLPSSIRAYAVDYDGNGRIDLEGSPVDAIGSVASFLHQHGWQAGQPVAVPAKIGDLQKANAAIETGIEPRYRAAELAQLSVQADSPQSTDLPAALIRLESQEVPDEFWLGYANFYAITRYNRSSFYAMSVYQLAEAVTQARKTKLK
ncbi:lytic murein transglycosylase B [Niveibacterium sp. SC-1]|uniref:lytic murein transglycosylase B n=1 Tax=Niveibacterium sp. SC-1 TaxID=3135646 RepID=UPI00311F1E52